MNILISGSTGFLGSYLLKSFVAKGFNVIALKRSESNVCRISELLNQCVVYNVNAVELSSMFKRHSIDVVINTVADYGRSNKDISSLVETNLMFGLKLLEESIANKVKVFINTDTLLDKNINAYAFSKSQLVDWMHFLSGRDTKMVNLKIEHMYGPLDDDKKFICWIINQLKQNVEKIKLTSGKQKRDFVYIQDVVTAYSTIVDNISILPDFETFEVGSGEATEVRQFIEKIYSELSQRYLINTILDFGSIPYRENENMNMIANISKLKKLGWNPTVSVVDGVKNITGESS
jgi:CDP-paratose synthetase